LRWTRHAAPTRERENVEKIRLANLKADVGVEWIIIEVMQWIFKKKGVKLRVGEPDVFGL